MPKDASAVNVMKYHNLRYRDFLDGKMAKLLGELNFRGYLASTKYNGWQVVGDRGGLYSKNGKLKIRIPQDMQQKLPVIKFVAELIIDDPKFGSTPHSVARLVNTDPLHPQYITRWSNARLMVFDVVDDQIRTRPFTSRLQTIQNLEKSVDEPWFIAITQHPLPETDIANYIHNTFLDKPHAEGVVFTHPTESYEYGKTRIKSSTLLKRLSALYRRYKLKVRQDATAVILGHTSKGTLFVRSLEHFNTFTHKGCEFIIGIGLSKKQKQNLDAAGLCIGAHITYSYCGVYESGSPSHAYFRHLRDEATI